MPLVNFGVEDTANSYCSLFAEPLTQLSYRHKESQSHKDNEHSEAVRLQAVYHQPEHEDYEEEEEEEDSYYNYGYGVSKGQ